MPHDPSGLGPWSSILIQIIPEERAFRVPHVGNLVFRAFSLAGGVGKRPGNEVGMLGAMPGVAKRHLSIRAGVQYLVH